ncbi:2-hydroxyacid dehydrogenase [Bacillus sp. FJAT-44742]|uniref:2-hydroxyacid dehydrogenase n=1 Tax=Bacillus sp. FJAT-44742 TaxID=2014005 RepID=UPI000C249A25|nr:D-glycerate dehydrogenase [Bacillus sp. FJAT-44742]
MKPKVIVYNRIPEDLMEKLSSFCDTYQCSPESKEFFHHLPSAKGMIGSGYNIDKKLLDKAPELKIVSNVSVGYNNLNIEELTKRGIMATNTPDVLTETTADTIFGLLLATARRMPELDRYVKAGKWEASITEELFGNDVHHKTLGMIGMGRIGAAVAERAHFGFKMNILYHNRTRKPSMENRLDASYVSLDHLLQNSDFVCVMVPLTPETANLIGEREFKLMKKSAIFINGSRGKVVKEEDLIKALGDKEILAAGLDVYREEPIDTESPLLRMDHCVTLPHIGSATAETRYKMAELAVENLIQGLQGNKPPSLINDVIV